MGRQNDIDLAWGAEEALLREEIRHDPEMFAPFLADDFHEIGQSGTHWQRQQIIDALADEPSTEMPAIVIDERRADLVADALILLTYRLDYGGRRSRRSSVWRVSSSVPLLHFHQGTSIR